METSDPISDRQSPKCEVGDCAGVQGAGGGMHGNQEAACRSAGCIDSSGEGGIIGMMSPGYSPPSCSSIFSPDD